MGEARRWMWNALVLEREEYEDDAGCCLLTQLAEDCADALDLYADSDYTIPDWVFDLACDVADAVGGFNA